MPYKVINTFNDKEQDNTLYVAGKDTYPKAGYETDPDRVKFLQKKHKEHNRSFLGEEVVSESGETDFSKLSVEELKKIKNDDLRAFLDNKALEYKSDDNKDDLIALILKKPEQE